MAPWPRRPRGPRRYSRARLDRPEEIGDGQVAPGKYRTAGPEAGDFGSCYWARLKNTEGDFDSIITNGNTEGPAVVTIRQDDGAFETRCTWTKSG